MCGRLIELTNGPLTLATIITHAHIGSRNSRTRNRNPALHSCIFLVQWPLAEEAGKSSMQKSITAKDDFKQVYAEEKGIGDEWLSVRGKGSVISGERSKWIAGECRK